MKRIVTLIGTVAFLGLALVGCAGNRDAIAKASLTSRQDVFQAVGSIQPHAGQALLKVDFPVKTYKSFFINTYYKHDNPPYTLTVNIDGQAVEVTAEPVLEDLQGDFKKNPEVGKGWKYAFTKALILQAGKHHLTIVVPLADVIIEKDITVKEGDNSLKLTPVYASSVSRYPQFPRFFKGLKTISVNLNSLEL